jgi:hypothetical protein
MESWLSTRFAEARGAPETQPQPFRDRRPRRLGRAARVGAATEPQPAEANRARSLRIALAANLVIVVLTALLAVALLVLALKRGI